MLTTRANPALKHICDALAVAKSEIVATGKAAFDATDSVAARRLFGRFRICWRSRKCIIRDDVTTPKGPVA